jgi:hypothetical protein
MQKVVMTASLLTVFTLSLGLYIFKEEKRRRSVEIKMLIEEANTKNKELRKLVGEAKKERFRHD